MFKSWAYVKSIIEVYEKIQVLKSILIIVKEKDVNALQFLIIVSYNFKNVLIVILYLIYKIACYHLSNRPKKRKGKKIKYWKTLLTQAKIYYHGWICN